ncbi:MAG TPA: hypothetical protein VF138_04810 [Caulobacteraceae bacterium]
MAVQIAPHQQTINGSGAMVAPMDVFAALPELAREKALDLLIVAGIFGIKAALMLGWVHAAIGA